MIALMSPELTDKEHTMKSFKQFDELLVGRCHTSKKIGNNTYAERREPGKIAIRLHKTDVVTYYEDGSIVLRNGGFRTPTTKDRINEHSPVRLSQHKSVWTFVWGFKTYTFKEGVTLKPDCTVEGEAEVADILEEVELLKEIAKFGKLVSESLPLPLPGAGDCLFCQCSTDKGEEFGGIEHLQSHLDEGYLVPSLVWKALVHAGCDPKGTGSFWFAVAFQQDDAQRTRSAAQPQIKRIVVKYLKRRFGLA